MENNELRKEYVNLRNTNQLNYNFFKDYYYSKCKECRGEEEFHSFFPMFFNKNQETIIKNMDNKMELVSVFNKKGELKKYL
tara:strand:+ start:2648 stop:2890 length:243 start_codon:yes stop_codon:yes gene_type:complete